MECYGNGTSGAYKHSGAYFSAATFSGTTMSVCCWFELYTAPTYT